MEAYRIADEPKPGGLAHLTVNPFWPFFAIMFIGPWLSWPWFIINGMALGSPTLRKEIALAIGGFVGSAALALGIFALADANVLTKQMIPFALLALTVWRIGITYWLQIIQGRTYHIHEYYNGPGKNGIFVLLLGSFFGRRMVANLLGGNALLQIVLI